MERLLELTREVDFAAFVFAQDDWTTNSPPASPGPASADTSPKVNARTAGVYLRADPEDMSILDGLDERKRAELIAERLKHWKSIRSV